MASVSVAGSQEVEYSYDKGGRLNSKKLGDTVLANYAYDNMIKRLCRLLCTISVYLFSLHFLSVAADKMSNDNKNDIVDIEAVTCIEYWHEPNVIEPSTGRKYKFERVHIEVKIKNLLPSDIVLQKENMRVTIAPKGPEGRTYEIPPPLKLAIPKKSVLGSQQTLSFVLNVPLPSRDKQELHIFLKFNEGVISRKIDFVISELPKKEKREKN